jgi:hypothetical protein
MKINWEALGVIVAIITALCIPLIHKLILLFEKYLKNLIKEEFNSFFDEKMLKERENIRKDTSEIFEEYYYPLDSQIKQCRENIKNTQQQSLQLNRINEVNIEKLAQKLKGTINNDENAK